MKAKTKEMQARVFKTAWGWCSIGVTANGLARLIIPNGTGKEELAKSLGGPVANGAHPAVKMITEYFAGKRCGFDIAVDFSGATDFERAVYRAVTKIPYGHTASYGEIAAKIGRRGAARAVGAAMARNPVPIVMPCHRVVRAGGGIGGFSARGGVATKQRLLAFEKTNREK